MYEIYEAVQREIFAGAQRVKERYPQGTRVELIEMNDAYAPPVGTRGTVFGVDAIGSIMVMWDNGSTLNVLHGIDRVKKVDG